MTDPTEIQKFLELVCPSVGEFRAYGFFGPNAPFHNKFSPHLDATRPIAYGAERKLNTYFALASFKARSRDAQSAQALRSVWVDLDCHGKENEYLTVDEALVGLRSALKELVLPKPSAVVQSGHGVQAYWAFTEDMSYERWIGLATVFKAALITTGLKLDTKVVSDAARVMRLPGTFNYRDPANPVPAKLLMLGSAYAPAVFKHALAPFRHMATPVRTKPVEENEYLVGLTMPKTMCDFKKTCDGCAQINNFVENGGNVPEPFWFAMAGMFQFFEGGREKFLDASKKNYPTFVLHEANKKFNQVANGKPPLCSTLRETSAKPGFCDGCKKPERLVSPASWFVEGFAKQPANSYPVANVEANTPRASGFMDTGGSTETQERNENGEVVAELILKPYDPPSNYAVNESGVFAIVPSKDGGTEMLQIYGAGFRILSVVASQVRGSAERTIIAELFRNDQWTLVKLPISCIYEDAKFASSVANCGGMILKPTQCKAMREFVSAFAALVQAAQADTLVSEQLGWMNEGDGKMPTRFSLGGSVYDQDGERKAPMTDQHEMIKATHTKGSLGPWKDAYSYYWNNGNYKAAFFSCVAWGAPLITFAEHKGGLLHVFGPANSGKTTLLKLVCAAYGDPEKMMLGAGGTPKALFDTIGKLQNLPVAIDEFLSRENMNISNMCRTITQGSQGGRMASSGVKQYEGYKWATIALGSSNESALARLQLKSANDSGGAVRIFEMEFPALDPQARLKAQTLFTGLKDNYGHAGVLFVRHIVKHAKTIAAEVVAVEQYLAKELATPGRDTASDRFLVSAAAAMLVGAKHAKKLGLHDMDVGVLKDVALQEIRSYSKRVDSSVTHGLELVNQFIADNLGAIASVNEAAEKVLMGEIPLGRVVGNYNRDTGEFTMSIVAWKVWLSLRGADIMAAQRDLEQEGHLLRIGKENILKGVLGRAPVVVSAWVIKL